MEAQGRACLPPMSTSVNVCKCTAPGLDAAKVRVSGVPSALEVVRTESFMMGFTYEKPRDGRTHSDLGAQGCHRLSAPLHLCFGFPGGISSQGTPEHLDFFPSPPPRSAAEKNCLITKFHPRGFAGSSDGKKSA